MFQLTTIFFGIAMLCVSIYLGIIAMEKTRVYFKKGKKLSEIEDQYDALCNQLQDLKHHYYWAQSGGEREKEKAMEQQIFQVEDKLDLLKEEYESIKKGKAIPLTKVTKAQ